MYELVRIIPYLPEMTSVSSIASLTNVHLFFLGRVGIGSNKNFLHRLDVREKQIVGIKPVPVQMSKIAVTKDRLIIVAGNDTIKCYWPNGKEVSIKPNVIAKFKYYNASHREREHLKEELASMPSLHEYKGNEYKEESSTVCFKISECFAGKVKTETLNDGKLNYGVTLLPNGNIFTPCPSFVARKGFLIKEITRDGFLKNVDSESVKVVQKRAPSTFIRSSHIYSLRKYSKEIEGMEDMERVKPLSRSYRRLPCTGCNALSNTLVHYTSTDGKTILLNSATGDAVSWSKKYTHLAAWDDGLLIVDDRNVLAMITGALQKMKARRKILGIAALPDRQFVTVDAAEITVWEINPQKIKIKPIYTKKHSMPINQKVVITAIPGGFVVANINRHFMVFREQNLSRGKT